MIHRQAYHLNPVLEDPRNHRTDNKGNVVWNNIFYPDVITEFLFDRNEENNYQSDFEASSGFEVINAILSAMVPRADIASLYAIYEFYQQQRQQIS